MGLKINGSTSGSIEIDVPAVAGTDTSITIPAKNGGTFIVEESTGNIDLGPLDINGSASDDSVNIDSSGRLLVGTSTSTGFTPPGESFTTGSRLQVSGSSNVGSASLQATDTSTNDYSLGGSVFLTKHRSDNAAVPNGHTVGSVYFTGYDSAALRVGAMVQAEADGDTWASGDCPTRLLFHTTADGASSPTERMRISQDGAIRNMTGLYADYSGSSANVHIASDGHLTRGSSSIRYKTQVEDLEDQYADALLECRPVWYRSTSKNDNPEWSFYGLIAEELADIDPRLVQWRTTNPVFHEDGSVEHEPCEPVAEGISYDRFVPHLLNLIKRQKQQLEAQAASIASLEARLTALEGGAA